MAWWVENLPPTALLLRRFYLYNQIGSWGSTAHIFSIQYVHVSKIRLLFLEKSWGRVEVSTRQAAHCASFVPGMIGRVVTERLDQGGVDARKLAMFAIGPSYELPDPDELYSRLFFSAKNRATALPFLCLGTTIPYVMYICINYIMRGWLRVPKDLRLLQVVFENIMYRTVECI